MTEDSLNSSDSVRSAKVLKHAQYVTLDEPLALELGGEPDRIEAVLRASACSLRHSEAPLLIGEQLPDRAAQ